MAINARVEQLPYDGHRARGSACSGSLCLHKRGRSFCPSGVGTIITPILQRRTLSLGVRAIARLGGDGHRLPLLPVQGTLKPPVAPWTLWLPGELHLRITLLNRNIQG